MTIKGLKGFPDHLSRKSIEERYKYFVDYSVNHTVLANAFKTLLATIQCPAGKQLILVIGPTRAGKTFLLEWIQDELRDLWSRAQLTDPGRIPVVGIEIPSKDRTNPAANDIYIRILEALEEPLLDKKTTYGDVSVYRNGEGKVFVEPASIARYRRAVEKALQFRRPCLLFDEAQHLLDIGGLTLEHTMDWVKSIANMGKCLIVLFGTYEMLNFVDLNEQLMCRSKIIHFHRYKNTSKDLEVFDNTLLSFQMNMPLVKTPNLLDYSGFLYERTGGCVGNLYNWLLAAYDVALRTNDQTLTLEHLTSTVPLTEIQAAKLSVNIAEDEKRFANEIGEEKEIKRNNRAKKGSEKESQLKTKPDKPSRKSRSNRVGERRPGRDKIGGVRKAA